MQIVIIFNALILYMLGSVRVTPTVYCPGGVNQYIANGVTKFEDGAAHATVILYIYNIKLTA